MKAEVKVSMINDKLPFRHLKIIPSDGSSTQNVFVPANLMSKFDIKQEELDLLIKYHLDDVKEELKYIKDGEKGNK